MVENQQEINSVRSSLQRLEKKLENLDFALNQMKTTLNRTNNNLTELESKADAGFNVLQDDLNMTRSQLLMMSDTIEKETLTNNVNTTLTRLENIDSALYQLKSALNRTNNDLAELNGTQTKTDVGFNALRDDFNIARDQLLVMSDKNKKDTAATVNTTLTRMENLDSDINQLKSTLNRTNNDLAKLNRTQTKTGAGFKTLRNDLNTTRSQLLLMSEMNKNDTMATVNMTLARLENLDSLLNQLRSNLNRRNNDLAKLNTTKTKLKSLDCALTQLKVSTNRTETDQAECNSTQAKLENLNSDLTELKSALKKTNDDLAEFNRTQTEEKVIYYQTMTPSWIEAHALYIDSNRSTTTEQLMFKASSVRDEALFKVSMIPKDVLQDSTPLTVKIVVFNDVGIGSTEDSDPKYGVSDGISFVGFETVDKITYAWNNAPCFGIEGTSSSSLTGKRPIKPKSLPRPKDSFYPGQFVITLKLDERWGSCYTAHDGGFLKTAIYNKRLMLSNGLYFEAYKDDKHERVVIKLIKVTIIRDA